MICWYDQSLLLFLVVEMTENVVANVIDQFKADLEPHVLQGISEMSEIETEKSAQ